MYPGWKILLNKLIWLWKDRYICVYLFPPEGHQEPYRKVGSQSPAERLVGLELRASDSECHALFH